MKNSKSQLNNYWRRFWSMKNSVGYGDEGRGGVTAVDDSK